MLAAALIPRFGWPAVFVIGGVAPLLLAPVLLLRLPESARFLLLARPGDPRLAGIVRLMFPGHTLGAEPRFTTHEPPASGNPLPHLFNQGRTRATVLLWVVFFMSLLDLYFLSNWLPSLLNELGATVALSAVIGAMLQVGGIVGATLLGRLVDRFSFGTLAVTYGMAVLAVVAIGLSGHSTGLAAVAVFCAGFCIVGGQTAANALAATFYPTAVRATGVGWALGIGRVGSIVGPLAGGVLLGLHWTTESLFFASAVPAAIAAGAALALNRQSRHTPFRTQARPA